MRMEVEADVQEPADLVWACLTDVNSWPKWWKGHRLIRVKHGWHEGAKLEWSSGQPSRVFTCMSDSNPRILEFGNDSAGMKVRRAFMLYSFGGRTKVAYAFWVDGASLAPGDEAVEQCEMQEALSTFCQLVVAERERFRTLLAAAPAAKVARFFDQPEKLFSALSMGAEQLAVLGRSFHALQWWAILMALACATNIVLGIASGEAKLAIPAAIWAALAIVFWVRGHQKRLIAVKGNKPSLNIQK